MTDFAAARVNMVEGQIRPNKVTDERLLEALHRLPRERFVPGPLSAMAYIDDDLPLGNGRFLIEPMVLARLLQEAEIGPRDRVLDIGCATGYSTALIAELAGSVVGVESAPELASHASRALAEMGARNASIVEAPLDRGHPADAPYDLILISGSVVEIPSAITDQLTEGGRLLTVVRPPAGAGHAMLTRRIGGSVSSRALFDAGIPYLPGFEPKPVFQF